MIVDINRPGVWILGGIKDEDRKMGLGVVVEYANQRGEPRWSAPPTQRGTTRSSAIARYLRRMNASISFKGAGRSRRLQPLDLNGKSWPAANPLFTTERGKRYRLAMTNKSGDNHPVHLHRHTFEVTRWATRRPRADERYDQHDAVQYGRDRFRRRRPGYVVLHCHHQDHQDDGFIEMMTISSTASCSGRDVGGAADLIALHLQQAGQDQLTRPMPNSRSLLPLLVLSMRRWRPAP